jgi:cobyrinic acid a,c-diamide synthase
MTGNKSANKSSLILPRIVISAPHRSSGKTTVSIGLCAAFKQSGKIVQPFKKGPDFIDPLWLSSASERDCYNLDYFMLGDKGIIDSFGENASGADVSIIEGNMGFYDGMETDGKGSTAELSRLLEAPVILVIDSRKMTRSIAPLINGFQHFEPGTRVVGVLLNRVSGVRHESKLRSAIERYCDIEVVGAIPRMSKMEILERHLGLRPSSEDDQAFKLINTIRDAIGDHVDLDKVMQLANSAPAFEYQGSKYDNCLEDEAPAQPTLENICTCSKQSSEAVEDSNSMSLSEKAAESSLKPVKIGVAKDKAFTFYYPENLESLKRKGAELVYFSPIADDDLPEVDALYIGGGFPEVFMDELEKNESIRAQIRDAIENGMPVYAECGGLMYLSRNILWSDKDSTSNSQSNADSGVADTKVAEMVGALPCSVKMNLKPKGHGYIKMITTGNTSDNTAGGILSGTFFKEGMEIKAHEFHYSELQTEDNLTFAYNITRGYGVDGKHDGILYKNVFASYAHLHARATPEWADCFLRFIKR